jgi:hypothetical protein
MQMDIVERLLADMHRLMSTDDVWRSASDEQLTRAHTCLERAIFAQVYVHALFPNDDDGGHRPDVERDEYVCAHIHIIYRIMTE